MPAQALVPFVIDPMEMRLLDGLKLNPRRTFTGRVRGERLTKRKGISIEFADYRDYTDGDDLRHLDWNVLARLENAVIKTYQDEEDLAVHVLLDCSASMDFGEPAKFETAQRAACAFAYAALCSQDAVSSFALGKRLPPARPLRGRISFPKFAKWAGAQVADGGSSLTKSLREFAGGSFRAGIALIVTDGLDPDVISGLRMLAGRGHEIWLIQILSDIEIDPDLEGDLKLVDAESGMPVEITANNDALKAYIENLKLHCDGIANECRRLGGRYTLVPTSASLRDVIKNQFKREGWLST